MEDNSFVKNSFDVEKHVEEIVFSIREPSRIDLNTLKQTVLESKGFRSMFYNGPNKTKDPEEADEATVERWIVNFIRHICMEYDYEMDKINLICGKNHDNLLIKYEIAVYEAIKNIYPEYSEECDRQLKQKIIEIYSYKLIWDV